MTHYSTVCGARFVRCPTVLSVCIKPFVPQRHHERHIMTTIHMHIITHSKKRYDLERGARADFQPLPPPCASGIASRDRNAHAKSHTRSGQRSESAAR